MLFMGRSLCPHELNQFSSFQCFSRDSFRKIVLPVLPKAPSEMGPCTTAQPGRFMYTPRRVASVRWPVYLYSRSKSTDSAVAHS